MPSARVVDMLNFDRWTPVTSGTGTVVFDNLVATATAATASGNRAFIQRTINVSAFDVVTVRAQTKRLSGTPKIIIDYPTAGVPKKTVSIDTYGFIETTVTFPVPDTHLTGIVTINIGIFLADAGSCHILAPSIEVNGINIDTILDMNPSITGPNGRAYRFANGLQVCEHELTLSYATADILAATWPLPAAFSRPPVFSLSLSNQGADYTGGVNFRDIGNPYFFPSSNTTATINLYRTSGATGTWATNASALKVKVKAEGQWG